MTNQKDQGTLRFMPEENKTDIEKLESEHKRELTREATRSYYVQAHSRLMNGIRYGVVGLFVYAAAGNLLGNKDYNRGMGGGVALVGFLETISASKEKKKLARDLGWDLR